jgi:glycosyltransferase involved in cell wall biosynthesis
MLADERTRVMYFVPPSEHFAGIERVVHEIADGLMALQEDALDVHVIFASHYEEVVLKDPRYTIHVLNVARLRDLPKKLREAVKGISPDIVVFPQVEASVLGWLATRGLGIPVFVSHLHGNPRLEEAEGTIRTRLSFLAFRHVVSKRIAAVLAVSPSLARYATKSLSRRAPVVFAKNPVRDLQAPARMSHSNEVVELVCVARLSRQKGQDILLRGLAIAKRELPALHLTLVGSGPDEEQLKALVAELGIASSVTFAGYVSDPRPFLSAADCFVLASRWEGFGVALAEALQFGLPVLSTDCDFGPADLIDDPRLGEVVPAEDPAAFAAGIIRASHRERNLAEENFRIEVAKEYLPAEASRAHLEILRDLARQFAKASVRLASLARSSTTE